MQSGPGLYKVDEVGQYLTIVKPEGGILSLAEVEAFGASLGDEYLDDLQICILPVPEDVEIFGVNTLGVEGVTCKQSSTGWGGNCERAYDGNTSG